MFSGIIEALGTITEIRAEPPGCRLIVREPKIAAETKVADSICVNGCCLTVIEAAGDTFGFQAGPETLQRTNLGELKPGSPVNLERALAVGDRLGGHFVSGHIDGTGTLFGARTRATGRPSGSRSRGSWPCRWPPKARSPWMA